MAPEELDRLTDERLAKLKADHQRVAAHHRALEAEAKAGGDKSIATTLGMLAANLEQSAALAEAERRDRAAKASARRSRHQKKEAASKPRPSRRPKVKGRITNMMSTEKATGTTFKTLMQRWEREPLCGLRLVEIEPGIYSVDDEDDEGVTGRYKFTTLQKMFSPRS